MKAWFLSHGYPVRIENSISSGIPDIIYGQDGVLMFIELKILHGGKISMPKYQYAFGNVISKHIVPHAHWVAVGVSDQIHMYMFNQVINQPNLVVGDKVVVPLLSITPAFVIRNSKGFADWIEYLHDLDEETNDAD
jgi:hypothetical protein